MGWIGVEDEGYIAENCDGGACIFLNLNITYWMPLPLPPKT